ncbi:MAG: AMP-binding enzyme, partial [Acidimicrobiia bacterium]
RVCAVVVPRDGASVDGAELIALCRSHLAGFKTPRVVHVVDVLPRNAAGKVLKQQLRAGLDRNPGQDGPDWTETAMDTDRNPDDDDVSELIGINDDALPRTDRDEDEQEAADLLEVDQKELEELGLVLDDPHQVTDE